MIGFIKNSLLYAYYSSHLWSIYNKHNKLKSPILMYHGVTNESFPVWTQVQEDRFEKQMKYIREQKNPVSLQTIVDSIKNRTDLPPYSVAVTFDDGFKNNYTTAYPILKKYNIPATIFVTTSFIDNSGLYEGYIWTDYIMTLLLETKSEQISVKNNILPLKTEQDKINAKVKICSHLKQIPNKEKFEYIQSLKKEHGVDRLKEKHDIFSGMNWDDVLEMDSDNLITFGAHTLNHEILSQLTDEQIYDEIIGGKEILSQKLGKPIKLFAYPNGQPSDYNVSAIKLAADNFLAALSTIEGLSGQDDDLYQLKRIPIGNDTKLWQFKLHLAGIYELLNKYKQK